MVNHKLKRSFDLIFSSSLIILLSPLIVLISVIIIFSLGFPIFFYQIRPGKDGKLFTIYKFRTMKILKDENGKLLPDHRRFSKIGNFLRRSSIDEIPELFNVFKGEMSIVGPRPLMVSYLDLYDEFQSRRHEVLPGITGWAQINGRNKITWNEKFKLDIWYIDNWSFFLDLKILYLTLIKVILMKDINQSTDTTMEPFIGNEKQKK